LDFPLTAVSISLTVLTAAGTQYALSECLSAGKIDLKSSLISALSLCLLLRVSDPIFYVFAAALAVGSKFLIRSKSKHFFNPTNFAIVAVLYLLPNQVWLSPGQWDSTSYFAFVIVALGAMIVAKAKTLLVSLSFLGFFVGFAVIRSTWLGDPIDILVHSILNGGFLIFVFLMISDPKSTPDHKKSQILFALLVAALTFILKFQFFEPKAPFVALFLLSPITPLLDLMFKADRFSWNPRESAAKINRLVKNS